MTGDVGVKLSILLLLADGGAWGAARFTGQAVVLVDDDVQLHRHGLGSAAFCGDA